MNFCPQLQNLQEEYGLLFCKAISAENPREFLKEYCYSIALMRKEGNIFEAIILANHIISIIEPNNCYIFFPRDYKWSDHKNEKELKLTIQII